MNRLSPHGGPPKSSSSIAARLARPMVRKPRAQMPHCLLAPMHYEPNYAYPLVIWLHDCGGDERELKRVMPLVSLRNYVSLSLRGTAEAAPAEGSRHRHGFDWPETADGILAAESRIADGIAQARQRFNVHPNRIFLAGHGSGGTLALRLGLRNPRQYAGAASIGGSFPSGHAPLARLAEARRSHLLIMHCRDSLSYPIACLCSELSLFHAAGMSVTMRQYPCGDELTTQMLRDLDAWLMEQVTGVPSTADQEHAPLPSQWN